MIARPYSSKKLTIHFSPAPCNVKNAGLDQAGERLRMKICDTGGIISVSEI